VSCCDYYAGMLRDSVIILRPHDVADGYGGNVTQWLECKRVGAQVVEVNNKKQWSQDRLHNIKTYTITTRADCDIEQFCRLVWRCTTLTIQSIIEPQKGWFEITATAGGV
jgi:head-tail adaptor